MKRALYLLCILTLVAGCTPKDSASAKTPVAVEKNSAADSFIDMGIAHLQAGEVVEAVRSFDDAIRQNPRDPKGYLILGQTYMRLNNVDRAIDTLSAVLNFEPDNGEAKYFLAVAYGLKGDREKAIEFAQKSMESFQEQQNQESFMRALVLLRGLANAQSQEEVADLTNNANTVNTVKK